MSFCEFGTVDGVLLLYDPVHDEVFVKGSGLVVMTNDRWLYGYCRLRKLIKLEKQRGLI